MTPTEIAHLLHLCDLMAPAGDLTTTRLNGADIWPVVKAARAYAEIAAAPPQEGWQTIETAPKDDAIFLAATNDGRMMIVRGSILANMLLRSTPNHLQFPATHWRPLPPAPEATP